MRQFSITMTASPYSTDQHERAQRFVMAALAQGHRITQVFFYHDAVTAAAPEAPIAAAWAKTAQAAACPLFVCVSAAERRGIGEFDLPDESPWEVVGLGDWVAGLSVDHALHFGA